MTYYFMQYLVHTRMNVAVCNPAWSLLWVVVHLIALAGQVGSSNSCRLSRDSLEPSIVAMDQYLGQHLHHARCCGDMAPASALLPASLASRVAETKAMASFHWSSSIWRDILRGIFLNSCSQAVTLQPLLG